MDLSVEIHLISPADAGEVFTLCRAAYLSEAELYQTFSLPPLTQTLENVVEDLNSHGGFVLRSHGRLIGTVQIRADHDVVHIGRLAVAPDLQGRGLGTLLLTTVEQHTDARVARLFTGYKSAPNIALYSRLGYVETHRSTDAIGIELVHLEKALRE